MDTYTKDKKPDAACRETAERLSLAMEVAGVGMWDWRPSENELYFDDRYYTMAGYAPGEFPATVDAWRAHIHPDDVDKVREGFSRLILGEEDENSNQFRFRTKSGNWIWILGRGRVFERDVKGLPLRIIGTHTDISNRLLAETEQFKSEDRFKRLVENSYAGIFISQECCFRYTNPSMARITGYTIEELAGRSIIDLVHPLDRDRVMDRYIRCVNGEDMPNYYTIRAIDKSGKQLWIELNAMRFEWQDQPAILSFVRDVTENKSMKQQLLQAQKMQAIGTLAGGIAHDFNNILSAMMGFTEICLSDVPADSRSSHRLCRVMEAGQRAKDLIHQILAFSRQEEIDQKPVNMALIVKETMKFIRASTPSTISLEIDVDGDTGVVMGDPTRIHQVIMNLCANASHAMREGGGVMGVSLANCQVADDGLANTIKGLVPGDYVRFVVSDTGHGMNRETVKKIFDPYFTTKRRGEGTGLGLSVVHGIVTNLGGAVTVYSEPGKGTAVHVYLPRIHSDEDASTVTEKPTYAGGNETILLVDDEAFLLEMTGEMLENLGYTVVSRTNGVEAFHAFSANPQRFDAVITDLTMPGMTGLELAEKIAGLGCSTPVILCSGFGTNISQKLADIPCARAVLKKPVLMREMSETIRQVLDG